MVRVVDYPDPYPLRTTKIITVEDMGGQGFLPVEVRPPKAGEALDESGATRLRAWRRVSYDVTRSLPVCTSWRTSVIASES
jgi:hypothetical protein